MDYEDALHFTGVAIAGSISLSAAILPARSF